MRFDRIPTYANTVYDVSGKYILKIFDSKDEWNYTIQMYAIFKQNKLTSPAIRATGKTPEPYIFMEHVKGDPIREVQTKKAYQNFGEWVGRLHQIRFNKFGGLQGGKVEAFFELGKGPFNSWKEMHLALIEHRMEGFEKTILAPLVPQVHSFFRNAKYPEFRPVLLHGDLNAKNIFVKNGIITGVIDPDGGFVGCAEEELMRIDLAHFGKDHLRKAFFQGYLQYNTLLSGYEDRRPLFRLSRCLVEAHHLIHLKDYKAGHKQKALQKVNKQIIAISSHAV